MSRLLAGALVALYALALADSAAAHGTLSPNLAAPGSTERFTIEIPNGRDDARITGLRVTLPDGVELEEIEARQPRWAASADGQALTWRGGPIEPREFDSFAFSAKLPDEEGELALSAQEQYDDGPGPSFRLAVTLAGATAGSGRDEGARTLALTALAVSLVAAAGALAAAIFSFSLLRRKRQCTVPKVR